ncbi:MAG: trypsin-like peptidase domain-containing protein [Planctomycetota bacterium]|nr:trypsin-like peptidase domain-containing protein [Planctomycetota bacterium]
MSMPNPSSHRAVTWGIVLGVVVGVVLAKVLESPPSAMAGGEDDTGQRQFSAQAETFRRAAALIAPSVVNITTMKKEMVVEGYTLEQKRDVWGYLHHYRRPKLKQGWNIAGIGSGFIFDAKNGYVLTNDHVVKGGDGWVVRLGDKRELAAQLVGRDPQTDLAVLKVEDERLQEVTLGDSDKVEVGDWVLAAGNPFGLLEQTITAGIISAKGRRGLGLSNYEDYLQTDAAINQGNSGGPLVRLDGQVVGINSAILSKTGGYQGIGFAIPINQAAKIARQLIAHGSVKRGWLGVKLDELPEELAKKLELEQGLLVRGVFLGGPAHATGLQPDDIILKANGAACQSVNDFRQMIADQPPGETMKLEVKRLTRKGFELKALDVKLGLQPEMAEDE